MHRRIKWAPFRAAGAVNGPLLASIPTRKLPGGGGGGGGEGRGEKIHCARSGWGGPHHDDHASTRMRRGTMMIMQALE